MKPQPNILDHLADAADRAAFFPGKITRDYVAGCHGPSETTALTVAMNDGARVRVTFQRLPVEAK